VYPPMVRGLLFSAWRLIVHEESSLAIEFGPGAPPRLSGW
jgi:hypothetical protein